MIKKELHSIWVHLPLRKLIYVLKCVVYTQQTYSESTFENDWKLCAPVNIRNRSWFVVERFCHVITRWFCRPVCKMLILSSVKLALAIWPTYSLTYHNLVFCYNHSDFNNNFPGVGVEAVSLNVTFWSVKFHSLLKFYTSYWWFFEQS